MWVKAKVASHSREGGGGGGKHARVCSEQRPKKHATAHNASRVMSIEHDRVQAPQLRSLLVTADKQGRQRQVKTMCCRPASWWGRP